MIEIRPGRGAVSAHFLYRAFMACQKLGARKPVLLNAMDVSEAELRNPQNRFSSEIVGLMIHAAKGEVGSKNLYRQLGEAMVPASFSDAGYSSLFERTVDDSLRASLIAQDLGLENLPYSFKEQGNSVVLVWDDSASSVEFIQLLFANLVSICDSLVTNKSSIILSMGSKYSRPVDFSETYAASMGRSLINIRFDQQSNYLEFDRERLRTSNPRANSQLIYAASRRRIGFEEWASHPPSFSKLCYNYLVYLLDKSGLSLDSAAESFSMAERTLRRKLVAEDESFRNILERVRRDACQLYFLEGGRSLSEIASKLGYSELSAFTRAYTSWYGHPPSKDLASQTALAA